MLLERRVYVAFIVGFLPTLLGLLQKRRSSFQWMTLVALISLKCFKPALKPYLLPTECFVGPSLASARLLPRTPWRLSRSRCSWLLGHQLIKTDPTWLELYNHWGSEGSTEGHLQRFAVMFHSLLCFSKASRPFAIGCEMQMILPPSWALLWLQEW